MAKWIAAVVLICFLVGCQSDQTPHKTPHTLRLNITREPSSMDPRKGSDWISASMHTLLFEGLMRLNSDSTLIPAQASSVEISDDRMTYIFHLRAACWSDGSLVTAQDFELAWKKIIHPQFNASNAPLLYPIKNAEKIKKGQLPVDQLGVSSKDDLTLIVQLEKPTPYFLNLTAFSTFAPVSHKIDKKKKDWMMEASPQFVSNGPFTLKKWKHHQEIVFEKNKAYWNAPVVEIDQIHVSMITDEHTALNMYQNGQLDVIGMLSSPIPIDALHHFHKKGALKSQSDPATTIITFNTGKFPFTNKHIRKALSYAIDRSQIVNNITQLGEEIATNVIPPCLDFKTPTTSYFQDHNIALAQQELLIGLKELKIGELPPVVLEYSSNEMNHKLAQVLQEQWKKTLGITINIQKVEHKVLLDSLVNRTYDLAISFWFAQYRDPMSILERFKYKKNAKNYPGWENDEYIRLMEQSAYDETSEKRAETLAAAEAILLEEMPLTPLYHWKTSFMMKDHLAIKGLQPGGIFDYSYMTIKDSVQ
jgi:oligopeptide transport system substrate-binding protein